MQPPSLHRYLYAYANPTVYTDPDGREQITQMQRLLEQRAHERDPDRIAELSERIRIEDVRGDARFQAATEELRDTAVGLYRLGKNIVKAGWETSILGYASGAGSEGVDALAQGGKHVASTLGHPIDNIYTPIRDQYAQANELDALGQTYQAEYVRQKAVLATQDVVTSVAGVSSLAKSAARGMGKAFARIGVADAKIVAESADGAPMLLASPAPHMPGSLKDVGGGDARYLVDSETGLTVVAEGRISGPHHWAWQGTVT